MRRRSSSPPSCSISSRKNSRSHEDPRIDAVEGMLPGANCGGCGYPGCRGLADALVRQRRSVVALLHGRRQPTRCKRIAEYLGKAAAETGTGGRRRALQRLVATKRPADERIRRSRRPAPIEATLYGGETGCAYGCLGSGRLRGGLSAFGAIVDRPAKRACPKWTKRKCTACGACVKACPKGIIELRKKE